MELQEKQYELDGVVFGDGCPVEIKVDGFSPGAPSTRTSDAPVPGSDGVRMGKDYKGSSVWGFSMYSNSDSESGAWAALAGLAAVWDDDEVRQESGAVQELRYCLAGQERVVYGRARRWTPVPTVVSVQGRIDVEGDFETVDHRFYSDELHSVEIPLGEPVDTAAGLVVPFVVPFDSSAGSSTEESSLKVGGDTATPIMVKFSGNVNNPQVNIGGWVAAVDGEVTTNDPVTIDARPWVRSATYQSGGGAPVSPRVTRLTKMWLPPGNHSVTFTGLDVDGSATALVSWRDAYRTLR